MSEGILPNNVMTQVAVVVRDIEEASEAYAGLFGVEKPSWRLGGPQEETGAMFRGQPAQGRAKLAFFEAGGVTIELIEPVGGPSTWRNFLDTHGEGVHHIAFSVMGMDDVLAKFSAAGMETEQTGNFPGGRYGYVDCSDQLKLIIELLERTE